MAKRFAGRFSGGFYRAVPAHSSAERLAVASIGIGTYLGESSDEDDARYEQAIHAALAHGCNVIDAAINYRCQRSERAAGRALGTAIADGTIDRDQVVVCTKGGFVPLDGAPPTSRDAYAEYLRREYIDAGILKPSEITRSGHAMTPRFLAHQIARSRANLGVDTIDVYYLHEPERQLESLDADAFGVALRAAIEELEAAVGRGEIARWGIASWRGLRVSPTARGHLSLADVVTAAHDVAGNAHHFTVVQVPINLAMSEAVRVPTQPLPAPDGSIHLATLLEAAHAKKLAVVASSPLMGGQLANALPDAVRSQFHGCATDAQRSISLARDLAGVSSVLVGMRDAAHLRENLRIAR